MSLKFLNNYAGFAHWALRIAIGSVFLFHGIEKFFTANMVSQMMGMPVAVVIILGIVETAAGGLVILGGLLKNDLMTRVGALLVIPVMLGAIFMVHLANGWSFMNNGFEFQLTLILVALYPRVEREHSQSSFGGRLT